jgi:RimJ/RimL family protein N-acetyltransferase
VAEKAGFTFEGVLRSVHVDARDGSRVDHAVYSLLREELR